MKNKKNKKIVEGNKHARGQQTNAARRLIMLKEKIVTSLAIVLIVLSILIDRFHSGETNFTTKCKYVP